MNHGWKAIHHVIRGISLLPWRRSGIAPSARRSTQLQISQRITWRHGLSLVLCAAGLALLLLNWHPADQPDTPRRQAEALRVASGMLLLIGAVASYPHGSRPQRFAIGRTVSRFPLLPFAGLGIVVIGWLTFQVTPGLSILGHESPATFDIVPSRNVQLGALCGGLLLFAVGILDPGELRALPRALWATGRQHWREILLVITLTGAALAVRLYRLGDLIPFFYSDEPPFAFRSQQIAAGLPIRFTADLFYGQTALGMSLMSYSLDLFGANLFAVRAPQALLGTLAVPGVYLMARQILNPWAGVLAALFLISQPVHVFFSRVTLYNVWDPTLGVYAVLLLWWGLARGGRWKFAAAGALFGVSQYLYTGARLWPPLVLIWLGIIAVQQPSALLRHRINLMVLLAGLALAMLPLLACIATGEYRFFQHELDMSHGQGATDALLKVQPHTYLHAWLLPAVRVFFDRGDSSLHFELAAYTALNLPLGFLVFAVGLAYGLRFALNPRLSFVLLWLLLTVILGGSLTYYIGFTRYVTAMLPLAVLAGIGLVWLAQTVRHALPVGGAPAAALLALALIAGMSAQNLHFILDTHPARVIRDLWPERWVGDALAKTTLMVPKDHARVYWIVAPYAWNLRMQEIYGFYNDGQLDFILCDEPVTQDWISTLDTDENLYFFVPPVMDDPTDPRLPPAATSAAHSLMRAFPGAVLYRYDSSAYPVENPPALYSLVYVPKGTPNLVQITNAYANP